MTTHLAPATLSSLAGLPTQLAETGYAIIDHFLSPALTAELLDTASQYWQAGQFRHAGIGRGSNRTLRNDIRNDNILWLEQAHRHPALADYQHVLEQLRLLLNRELQLGLFEFEGHLAVYPPGARYHKHVDQLRGSGARQVSCILYLNHDWIPADGGALRLYLDGDAADAYLDILPHAGRLVCFLSEQFYHEVLPARRERFSITGWFKRREAQVI